MSIQRVPLGDVRKHLRLPCGLFVCSSSFETRCLSIPRTLCRGDFAKALILVNTDRLSYVKENRDLLLDHFSSAAQVVDIQIQDPLQTADRLCSALVSARSAGEVPEIVVDVTTFTHESLLILLKLLQIHFSESSVTVVYASASEYSVGDAIEDKWLSKGVVCVRTVLGYPGTVLPSRQTHLVLLVGYEHQRATRLIEILEPSSLSLGYGKPGSTTTDKDKDASRHYAELVKRTAGFCTEVTTFEFSCNDPFETRDIILRQCTRNSGKNIVLAPMSNKMSTIGAALAAFSRESIQVCYAPALHYNYAGYSQPSGWAYVVHFPNGFSQTITTLVKGTG